jgi:hypothetical protein
VFERGQGHSRALLVIPMAPSPPGGTTEGSEGACEALLLPTMHLWQLMALLALPWRGRIERGALFRIPNFSKEYTQHALKEGLVLFFHKLIQKKEGASLGVSSSTWERWWERERATSTPQPAAAHSPPPVPCTPQPANAAALCIAVSLFQITSPRVRDLHPDGEVAAIAGGASLGVLVLWPWEWPWGRPWRRPWERPRERRIPHARSIV